MQSAPLPTASPVRSPALPAENFQGQVLLRAEGLKKRFGGQVVLDGLDLELRQGEVVLLRGENGSGKTTLLNILTGNLEPDAGTIHYQADDSPRTYHFPRRWWQELNPFDHFTPEFVAREGVCRTWQDIRLFNSQTLRDNIAVAEPGHPGENPIWALFLPRRSAHREAKLDREAGAMLERLGLEGREDSSADRISLGQSKRVAIARAVAAGARILFLDEPLAGLDRTGIESVLALLTALVADHRITLVIVEHLFNQPYLESLVTKDWLLLEGRIDDHSSNDRALGSGRSSAAGSNAWITSPPAWLSFLTVTASEVTNTALAQGALLTTIRRRDGPEVAPEPVLEIRSLVIRRGSRVVVGQDDQGRPTGFSLTVRSGEIVVLQAPNGWGKTTLIAAIAGLIPIEQGEVLLNGRPLGKLAPWARRREGLVTLPSDGHLFPSLRVVEVLRLAQQADDSIEDAPARGRVCGSLSGGERRRLAIQGMPKGIIGLCDEPFGALDQATVQFAVARLLGQQDTLLITEPYRYGEGHDRD